MGMQNPNLLSMERLGKGIREYAKPWKWSVDWWQDKDNDNVLQLDLFTIRVETGYNIDNSKEAQQLRTDLLIAIKDIADKLNIKADIYTSTYDSRPDNFILEYSADF